MPKSGVPLVVLILILALAACELNDPLASPSPPPATRTSLAPASASPTITSQALASIAPREGTESILNRLGAAPCPDSQFTCVRVQVPVDHFDLSNPETIEVVFAVLPAGGERKGMFVTAVGGPGYSGLAAADSYASSFDPAILELFDVVFFDQRGVAASGRLQCVIAATAFYRAGWDASTPEGEAALVENAERFAHDCAAETANPELLPYLGTEQAIEDLEAFRREMGDERFWLYGESYGTQFAQAYAESHPDHLAGLILDGPVDLTISGLEYLKEQAAAFSDILELTLEACAGDKDCATDVGSDPQAAYDDLASSLASGPRTFDFPLGSGGTAERSLSFADLETAASTYLYSEPERMMFLRALASAASRGDLVPMARLLYDSLDLDPQTVGPDPDPSYSDAVYYAVECNDYDYGPIEEYLRAGDSVDGSGARLSSIFYGDLPCTFWPVDEHKPGRPPPLTAEGIPTLVLVGTADPATPIANAHRIIEHLVDGYLVVEQGGPHVIFGWGNECVDDIVDAFLVEDAVPLRRETSCEGVVIDPYIPLPPTDAADFEDPLQAMASLDTEIQYLPEYYYWDGGTPIRIGCSLGGSLEIVASEAADTLDLVDCAFTRGFVLSGKGEYRYNEGSFTLDVSVAGTARGEIMYTREADGSIRVRGELDGKPVDLSE